MAVNPIIIAFGETKRAKEWIKDDRCKINSIVTLNQRIFQSGWDVVEAFETPIQNRTNFDSSKLKKGEKFGYLELTGEHKRINKKIHVGCKCICGKTYFLEISRYNKKDAKSCGCKNSELISKANRTHGLSRIDGGKKTPLYSIWSGIRHRCYGNGRDSKNYGNRGIKVDFIDFLDFKDWALSNGWVKGLTIERNDVNGNYSRKNCKCITISMQQRNKRNTIWVTAFGETKTIPEWIEDSRCVRSYMGLYDAIVNRKLEPEYAIMNKKRCPQQIRAV